MMDDNVDPSLYSIQTKVINLHIIYAHLFLVIVEIIAFLSKKHHITKRPTIRSKILPCTDYANKDLYSS